MPENTTTTTTTATAATTTTQPQPDELFAGTANTAEDSRFEKIIGAGERVFQKFNILRPGRGRPRKDGSPKKSDLIENFPGGPATGGNPLLAAHPAIPAQLDQLRVKAFAAGACGILRGAVALVKKWVARKAADAKIDTAFTTRTLAECQPSDTDFKEWQEAAELVAMQYRIDFEHMPAVNLAAKTVAIFAPFVGLAGEFKKEIARQRAKDLANPAGTSSL